MLSVHIDDRIWSSMWMGMSNWFVQMKSQWDQGSQNISYKVPPSVELKRMMMGVCVAQSLQGRHSLHQIHFRFGQPKILIGDCTLIKI